jgi:hypothetical protein
VIIVPDHPGREAVAPQVTGALPARIEPLRMAAVQVVECGGDVDEAAFDKRVVVREHEAPGVDANALPASGVVHQRDERTAVEVVPEDA